MATRHKVTVSIDTSRHRLSSAERREAQRLAIDSKQAELKREAAERRARRAGAAATAPE
jgi:hypothetical protein